MRTTFFGKKDLQRILDCLSCFHSCRIMVVGDVILDEFVFGKVNRISPEAPVPIVEVNKEFLLLGGAANVVNNIVSLRGKSFLCGVIGGDGPGREITRLLMEKDCSQEGLIIDNDRKTTVKTRVIANNQQVVRFDRENKGEISDSALRRLQEIILRELPQADVVVISDYGKGVINRGLMDFLIKHAKKNGKPVLIDPKLNQTALYRGSTFITPNHHEASGMSGIMITDEESLRKAGTYLLETLQCDGVVITRGEKGMSVFNSDGGITDIPAIAREVYDVTGAGDTVIGVLSLGVAAGLPLLDAAFVANVASGIVVGEVGTAAVSFSKLDRSLRKYANGDGFI